MRVVRRSVQGDHPSPGRGQAIASTMDEPGTPIRRMVGATLAFKSAPKVGTQHSILCTPVFRKYLAVSFSSQAPSANYHLCQFQAKVAPVPGS
jgi:hypothetical protein